MDGTDTMDDDSCTYPDTFSELAFRVTELQLGTSGKPGQGLDVDGVCTMPAGEEMCPAGDM